MRFSVGSGQKTWQDLQINKKTKLFIWHPVQLCLHGWAGLPDDERRQVKIAASQLPVRATNEET